MFLKKITTASSPEHDNKVIVTKYIQEVLYIATRRIKVTSILAEEGDDRF
jgi:hypothetical protein